MIELYADKEGSLSFCPNINTKHRVSINRGSSYAHVFPHTNGYSNALQTRVVVSQANLSASQSKLVDLQRVIGHEIRRLTKE
jgi:hypothetical protein